MSKGVVWAFGDSFTDSFIPPDWKNDFRHKYVDWKGYIPKVYCEIIAEHYDMEFKNFGLSGGDNYSILEEFSKESANIKEEDIVIIGWSNVDRFRLVAEYGEWVSLLPNYDHMLFRFKDISESTLMEIFNNRMTKKNYLSEINNWIKLIDTTLKNVRHVHWTPFNQKINALKIHKMNTIEMETKGLIRDGHFSEIGHEEISQILIKMIENFKNKTLI